MNDIYCNNCGKAGHIYNQCKIPITSFGVIVFRKNPETAKYEYLMIRRKDTLGYIDFMRGKYLVQNKHYILNMLKQMTLEEKINLKTQNFEELWKKLWGNSSISNKYKTEHASSSEKFSMLCNGISNRNDFFTLTTLIEETEKYTDDIWTEPEWGFPKGRRNYQEKDYECAIREFYEETGYPANLLKNIQNIHPLEEIFTGSNYKSYKHKYYLMYMNYQDSLQNTHFEPSEVSKMEWKTFEDCISVIRPYNLEKIRMLKNIDQCLKTYLLYQF